MNPDRKNDAWDPDRLRRRFQAMDDYEFEHLVGDLWGTNPPSESQQEPSQSADLDSAQSSYDTSGDSQISESHPSDEVNAGETSQGENSATLAQQTQEPQPVTDQESSIHTDPSEYNLLRTNLFYGVAISTGAWALTWLLMTIPSNAVGLLGGLLILIAWPLYQ